ncbi:glycoside hydrolase family 6 protein [Nocardioides sp. cx-169]|uniref:glycoside hydrolase family 6 protein n=1 Tax=Nocardioides sp. cx-169 TaxID=2899080 RepID=UPI001E56C62C|nr:glycoside hydrolase family 6 protein [Nocardioides sp. cx-169]MCD4535174.1 glycoside hydrolase family 6 protein [Nocardioides sp. cx-169]
MIRRALVVLVTLAAALTLAAPAPASASPRAEDTNPLAGRAWGVYGGRAELAWQPYVRATGWRKKLLAKIALRPKAKWFGGWIPDDKIAGKVREYVANATGGDPEVMVSMSVFRMRPWERTACKRLPTKEEKASYRRWINRFARALGDTHTMLVLQPDGPFALCAPGGSKVPSRLIAWSARVLSDLPNTHVYLEAGASDWLRVDEAVQLLVDMGVEHTRGLALNTTHYDSPEANIRYGAEVADRLATRGMPGKKVVVDTSQSGRPFTYQDWRRNPQDRDYANAAPCRNRTQDRCVTLGIPPTADVTDPATGLSAEVRELAGRYVDAFVWSGRPWLFMQTEPFLLKRALNIARTTPY